MYIQRFFSTLSDLHEIFGGQAHIYYDSLLHF